MSGSTSSYLSFLVQALTGASGGAASASSFADSVGAGSPDAGPGPAPGAGPDAGGGGAPAAGAGEQQRMQTAFQASRTTLGQAIAKMDKLIAAIQEQQRQPSLNLPDGVPQFDSDNAPTFQAVVQWLKVDANNPTGALSTVWSARSLMMRNSALSPQLRRGGPIKIDGVMRTDYHAYSTGSVAGGLNCGDVFFTTDSPECNRDVVTHECFHMLGIHHGGAANDPVTHRDLITTPEHALDSADNLAQLVSQLATGKTDSCT
jgi:hypothetical protein